MADPVALSDRLRSLLHQEEGGAELRQELAGQRAEDLAAALERLSRDEGRALLEQMDSLKAGYVMVELPTETARGLAADLPDEVLAVYLDVLPMDDAIDLHEELGDERFDVLLNLIPPEDAREIRRLLYYPERSVGRAMTEKFFEASPDATMQSIMDDLRLASEDKYETVNDVYVVDEDRFLKGVFSLRRALRAEPGALAREVMNPEPIVAHASERDEEAARRMARYGFYSLPVIDERGRMVGLFTGDDAQTVLREAESEDVLALGAVTGSVESYISLSPWQLYKRRFPWLLILFVAETLTGGVMRHYTNLVEGDPQGIGLLIPFIPLVLGAGGNSGSQVTTTITRGLAVGEVELRDAWLVFVREMTVALMIGGSLGVAGFLRAYFGWNSGLQISAIVAVALPLVVTWAATVGSLLPLAAKRLNIDPAVMSAPFISTFVDATGLVIYFEVALRLFRFK
ncbi:MAG: magnesium transporter [Fimbriimonadaceae bacterium]|nr:magnesium transporter [Fimbriimonadaceae bacterium]QYK55754.1 MAG: magnesium transporter [Fimbriimonadaceae bacterium]